MMCIGKGHGVAEPIHSQWCVMLVIVSSKVMTPLLALLNWLYVSLHSVGTGNPAFNYTWYSEYVVGIVSSFYPSFILSFRVQYLFHYFEGKSKDSTRIWIRCKAGILILLVSEKGCNPEWLFLSLWLTTFSFELCRATVLRDYFRKHHQKRPLKGAFLYAYIFYATQTEVIWWNHIINIDLRFGFS